MAKSVSEQPWAGNQGPRLSGFGVSLVNHIGIQNPGIERWCRVMQTQLPQLSVPVWGSVVGRTPEEYGRVAERMSRVGVAALEVNLSCPNLDETGMWTDRLEDVRLITETVRATTSLPFGVKLQPEPDRVVELAKICRQAGADWVVLTNTISTQLMTTLGKPTHRRFPAGGYSGPVLRPVAVDCVRRVTQELPGFPVVGVGGVSCARDAQQMLESGAQAVGLGTVHFYRPRAAQRIARQLQQLNPIEAKE